MTDMLVTGMTLKLERVARNVKQGDLAERMGVSRSYLSMLEGRYVVPAEAAERYRKYLASFPSLTSPSEPLSAA